MLTLGLGSTGEVQLVGSLDAAQAGAAQSYLDGLHGAVTLDCSQLDYISSAGLGVLLKTHKRLLAGSGKLRLVAVNSHLRDIFKYSGFDQIFEIAAAQA